MEEVIPEKAERLSNLGLLFEDNYLLQEYEQFEFDAKSIHPNLTDSNNTFLDKTAEFLKNNEDKGLTLVGAFRSSEKDERQGFVANLGLARAIAVRDLLTKRGIDESRISIDAVALDGEEMNEPVAFNVYTIGDNLKRLQYSFHDMTYFSDAHFDYNSAVFKPGKEFIIYADSVKKYLETHKDKTLTIVGHTDNLGSDKYNDKLGQDRAEAAKAYFKKMDLDNKIIAISKGEKEPIASNDTEASKSKNRRVNFIIER